MISLSIHCCKCDKVVAYATDNRFPSNYGEFGILCKDCLKKVKRVSKGKRE